MCFLEYKKLISVSLYWLEIPVTPNQSVQNRRKDFGIKVTYLFCRHEQLITSLVWNYYVGHETKTERQLLGTTTSLRMIRYLLNADLISPLHSTSVTMDVPKPLFATSYFVYHHKDRESDSHTILSHYTYELF